MIKKKMQKSFIKLLLLFISIVLLSGMLLFYSSLQFVFLNYMDQANGHLVKQISSTFELVIEQVTDKANKLGIYDNDIVQTLEERDQGVLYTMKLYETLDSIVLENKYLHSAYLYLEDENIIFDSKTGCSYKIEEFYNQAAANAMKNQHFSKVEPHAIKKINDSVDLLYSVIVVLPQKTSDGHTAMLSINVDMNKVYQDIMKRNASSEDGKLFIYNQDNQILVSADSRDLGTGIDAVAKNQTMDMDHASFWTIISNKSGVVNAFGNSKELGWNFCLQVPFEINSSSMINKYVAFIFLFIILALVLLIIYIVMHHTTKPLDTFLRDYNENIMKKVLTEPNFMRDKSSIEQECMEKLFCYDSFMVMMIEMDDSPGELSKVISACISQISTESKKLFIEPVSLYHGKTAIVCNYHAAQSALLETTFLNLLYSNLKDSYSQKIYIAISTPKQGYSELYMAVKECEEILEYKLSLPQHVMTYGSFVPLKGDINYPSNFEKQLINNLLVSNLESCIFYLDKYMEHLFHNHSIISDMNIKNYIYQLQAELFKHISSLPVSIKTSNSLDLKLVPDREYIYDSLSELIHTICQEITKKNSNNENILVQSILDYIHNHLADDDFNLNTISYQFNMNRNYLAKIIKENTSYSFNDYVNYKRIELAKKKLADENLTIEQISNLVGFSYSHYFIKVFKSMEGVTPGAYRKTIMHNTNAPV